MTVKHYVIYRRMTGEITFVGTTPRLDWVRPTSQLEGVLEAPEAIDGKAFYVDTAKMELRPVLRMEPSIVGTIVHGIPIGATIHAYGSQFEVTENPVRLSFNIPGPHPLRITAPRYAEIAIVVPDEG